MTLASTLLQIVISELHRTCDVTSEVSAKSLMGGNRSLWLFVRRLCRHDLYHPVSKWRAYVLTSRLPSRPCTAHSFAYALFSHYLPSPPGSQLPRGLCMSFNPDCTPAIIFEASYAAYVVDAFLEEKTSSPRLGLPGVILPKDLFSRLFDNEHRSAPIHGTRPD
ncbi:hypothetical protein BGW80DRAFT_70784 [Lactifluus volemus]|nr:hypothetical protein BGW80DRAFT_70784 [Lactifluus volemus]